MKSAVACVVERLERRTLLTTPVISNFNFNYETTHSLTLDISPSMLPGAPGVTNGLTSTDLILEKVNTDTNVLPSSILLNYNGSNPATFSFTAIPGSPNPNGTVLVDGNYRGSISKQDLVHGTDEMADDAVLDFFVFAGDLTGGPGGTRDRQVNLADFNILAANFGMTGATYSQGDVNYDGVINLQDFNKLAGNFGKTLPAPPTNSDEISVGEATSSSLKVFWFDTVSGETGWRVQQSSDGQTFDVYHNVTAPGGSGFLRYFEVPNLQDGSRYWFRVRAYSDPATNPDGPNTAYTPKRAANTVLPAPQLTSVTALSSSQIRIQFTDNSQHEDEFRIFRSLTGTGDWIHVGTAPAGATQYIDFGLASSTTYHYYVQAHNTVAESSPSNFANAPTQPGTALIDLDVIEDTNGDLIHDNSNAAEQLENTQPTALPYLEEDGDYEELALLVNGAAPAATVTFNYSQTQLQLYRDIMGQYPVNPGQVVSLADFTISGTGIAPVFAKANTDLPSSGVITVALGNGSVGTNYALAGGTIRLIEPDEGPEQQRPDDPAWHDNTPDNYGGWDDGDGPAGDLLTDRDGFWVTNAGRRTLIIGFAGHTQSHGRRDIQGQIWRINDSGPRQIGQQIYNTFGPGTGINWAVTMFPEDPGNHVFFQNSWCGDGVIGKRNPYWANARVDANNQPTGALAFLIDAIMNHNVNRVGLFGYSHGAGSVQILMKALAAEAYRLPALRDRLLTGLGAPRVNFFWTTYIDAIHIDLTILGGGQFEATGLPFALQRFPIEPIPASPYLSIGTWWHYNVYQRWTSPFIRDGVPLGGTELDEEEWYNWGRDPDFLRQTFAEPSNPVGLWPNGTDHTTRIDRRGRIRGRGIAEDANVQPLVISYLWQAFYDTYLLWP